MTNSQSVYNKLISLVEQLLNRKIAVDQYRSKFIDIPEPEKVNEQEVLRRLIKNRNLINQQIIHQEISKQLNTYKGLTKSKSVTEDRTSSTNAHLANASILERWQAYTNKVQNAMQQIIARTKVPYLYNLFLPTQRELFELQEECLQLTREWYGERYGNINYFYLAFIKMCALAHVSRFDYYQIDKFISVDQYVSRLKTQQRKSNSERYLENYYYPFIEEGGRWACGHSEIDATSIPNIFYYKDARQLLYLEFVKVVIVDELGLTNYGQVPSVDRKHIWQQITKHFPADTQIDKESIFYKFAAYINDIPSEYYNFFAAELPEANEIAPEQFFDIIKIAGLQSGKLIMFSRTYTEDLIPKRYLYLELERKYPLVRINDHVKVVRKGNTVESIRIWPNELPYAPEHGMCLCGDGLLQGLEHHGSFAYEWNTPIDPSADFDNDPRDIEMLFRQFAALNPNQQQKPLLPGEQLISVFQNTISYSTMPATSHTHVMRRSLEHFLVFNLPATLSINCQGLSALFELVVVGTTVDACYLRIRFSNLENEALIKFIMAMHQTIFEYYHGAENIDAYIHLASTAHGEYAFIYEPHARLLLQQDNSFLNPDTNQTSVRKPQWLIPEGGEIKVFDDELALGLEFLRKFYTATAKPGVHKLIADFITNYLATHPE